MMKNRILYVLLFSLVAFNANAQYEKGQWGFGGEFSFANSRNSIGRTTTDFAESTSSGIKVSALGGKFITPTKYLYGVLDIEYTNFTRDFVTDNVTNKTEQSVFSSNFTLQVGIGLRRYFMVNKKNIVGFFVQGQVKAGNSWVNRRNFATQDDSVLQDFQERYPVKILAANINPGVYINITPQWQMTVNIGNLYFTQTFIPEYVDLNIPKTNSSFGLDINLFDFKLGVLYTPK